MVPERIERQFLSQVRIPPSSAARAGEARPDSGGVSEPRASVFLEHNLVSVVILVIAAAAALVATARLTPLGPWWTRVTHEVSRVAAG